jgi:hypothetical protein
MTVRSSKVAPDPYSFKRAKAMGIVTQKDKSQEHHFNTDPGTDTDGIRFAERGMQSDNQDRSKPSSSLCSTARERSSHRIRKSGSLACSTQTQSTIYLVIALCPCRRRHTSVMVTVLRFWWAMECQMVDSYITCRMMHLPTITHA